MTRQVCVLLSTYNGEEYIRTQLDSVLNQEDVEVFLYIRDDGSKDQTREILHEYAKNNANIFLVEGKNLGFVQSFWTLVKETRDYAFYAFCDQDDIWDKDKLKVAVGSLMENKPMLYTSNVISVNNDMEVLKEKGFPFEGVLSYPDALQRPVLPGCTFVWNNALHIELQKYSGPQVAHDWTTYIIASAIGKVVYDSKSHIRYRIHGNNAIGVESFLGKVSHKMHRFIHNDYKNVKSDIAQAILDIYSLDEYKQKVTMYFAQYRKHPSYFFKLMHYKEYQNLNFIFLLITRKV